MRIALATIIVFGLGLAVLAFSHGSVIGYVGGTIDLICVAVAVSLIPLFTRSQSARKLRDRNPYQIGYEEGNSVSGDTETLRGYVRLAEERVQQASPHTLPAALGLLAGYRAALVLCVCGHPRGVHGIPGIDSTFVPIDEPNESMAESPPCMATVDGERCRCVQFREKSSQAS